MEKSGCFCGNRKKEHEPSQTRKKKYHLKVESRKCPSVSFIKRRDHEERLPQISEMA
jgi:hypothetical protein